MNVLPGIDAPGKTQPVPGPTRQPGSAGGRSDPIRSCPPKL